MKTYTIAGQPAKPQNGHVLIRKCKDPTHLRQTGAGLTIAVLGVQGSFIGEVVAVDANSPHIVQVGDTIYCRDVDVTLALKADEGETLFAVRECLCCVSVTGVTADPLTDADAKEIIAGVQKERGERHAAAQIVKNVLVQQ